MNIESLQRILIERGNKDDRLDVLWTNAREHVEAVHLRHLDVEKNQIGRKRVDGFDCLAAIATFFEDLDLRISSRSTRRLRRASGSSSTIECLDLPAHDLRRIPQRHHDHDLDASAISITNIELVIVIVELLQPRDRVCQTDPGAAFQLPVFW